ncbi:hypothetical protein CGLO_18014 [Colletotrichum gloeosporioides Cg-14]|uniref:Uncharacterized protein n=1 Tax=Colletotrichum gloeosporioides (strain Cg-14) TaxID=1237896 RepID=T0L527_COLGC|nr:hypothetical protein CGLO_18014 [Colletotrichum gloeosporioides Cg-14]
MKQIEQHEHQTD